MVQSKSVTAALRARDNGFTSTFRKANTLLGTFSNKQQQASSSAKGFLSRVTSVAVGMGVYKGVANIASLATSKLSSAFGRIDTMTNFNRTMGLMKFNTQETKATLDSLKTATKGTAYGLDVATKSAQNFITRGLNPAEATKSVSIWMDAVSTYGKGTNEELAQVTDALAKMRTKGTVEMDQLNRLFDVGIDAVGMYAKATGRASSDVQDDLSHKKISTKEFLDVVETAMTEGTNGVIKLAGAAKEAGSTWTGTFDNMGAAVTRGVTSIIDKMDVLSEKVTGKSLKTWVKDFGDTMEKGLGKVGSVIEVFANNAIPYINIVKGAIQDMKKPIADAFKAVISNVGFLNSSFSKTDALRGFSNVVGTVSDKIVQFSGFIKDNSVVIGKAIDLAPQLLAGFMAFKAISTVTSVFATFGTSITSNVLDKLERLKVANNIVSKLFIEPVKNTLVQGTGTVTNLIGVFGAEMQSSFNQSMATINPNKYASMFKAVGDGISYTFPKFTQFATVATHPVSSLKSLAINLAATSAAAGQSGTIVSGAAIKIGQGFNTMKLTGISAIKKLNEAMLSNPITAILVAITATIATVALAWRSNFMNIQNVIKSFGAGIGKSLSSMKSMFKRLEPIIKPVVSVFKVLGSVLLGGVLIGVSAVVDVFRTLVLAVTTIIKAVQALAFGISGLWKKIKRDSDGADESFAKMRDSIDSIGEGFNSWKENSAIVSTTKSLGEFGKTAEDTSQRVTASFDLSAKRVSDFSSQFSTKISETNSKFSELFAGENSSDRLKAYTENGVKILTDFGEKQVAVSEKYNDLMQQAEQAKGDEQQAILTKANNLLLSENRIGNASMLALYKEYSDQLKSNKNVEGQELTAEQRQALREQTNAIREGLAEQNELYVQASLNKLEMEGKLSESEQKAAESNLKALYTSKKEQIASNEEEIAELQKQRDEAKTESEKQSIQAQIDTLAAGKEQMLEQQKAYGDEELSLILNGNELSADAVTQGLLSRKDITDEQLGQIYQSFVNSSGDIDENMALLGGILSQRGFEGAQKLGDALRSGNLSVLGGELTAEMQAGISGLPNSMFWGGNAGKTMFIRALRDGDYAGAGKFITESVDGALQQGTTNAGKEGTNTGKDYSSGVSNEKGNAKKSGTDVSTSTTEGLKSQQSKQQEAGKSSGTKFVSGVSSQKGNARTAGEGLANAAYNGANSQTGSFNSIGYNMGAGVSQGLYAALPSVSAAASAIAAQAEKAVKAKAQIKSPARKFIPLGEFMGKGVGVGWLKSVGFIKNKVSDVITAIQSEFDGGLATSHDLELIANAQLDVTHKQDNSFTNSLIEEVRALKEYVQSLQMQIYLDNDVLVGEMDKGLGSRKDKTGRYKL